MDRPNGINQAESREAKSPAPPPNPIVDALVLDLVEWVAGGDYSYAEVMDAWRTSCPRLTVWEEATDRGLLGRARVDGRQVVTVTASGHALLAAVGRAVRARALAC